MLSQTRYCGAAVSSGVRALSYAGGKIPPTTQNIINGQWVESTTDRWIDVLNPATNQLVTRVPQSTQAEMEQAVESCKAAYSTWSKTTPLARQQVMFKYGEIC